MDAVQIIPLKPPIWTLSPVLQPLANQKGSFQLGNDYTYIHLYTVLRWQLSIGLVQRAQIPVTLHMLFT